MVIRPGGHVKGPGSHHAGTEERPQPPTGRTPVTDWATDFDHQDPAWTADPYPIWDELRTRCPLARSQRFGTTWLPTTHAMISAVAYDTEHFSSCQVTVREPGSEHYHSPPITSDPPEHGPVRRLLTPAFSPQAVAPFEPVTRHICTELLDAICPKGRADAATEYAQHIPVRVIANLLGVPASDGDLFRHWLHVLFEIAPGNPRARDAAMVEIEEYFRAAIAAHRRAGHDDLICSLLAAELGGEELSEAHILGTLRILLLAGVDTTWSAIGASLWHLARHPDDRHRLVEHPGLFATATEELLRAYAPVTMARLVVKEVELDGHVLQPGDQILLPFPAANRDPAAFPDAHRVILDRTENRHVAFGLGIHRCLGSHLARLELRIALQEWLARIPEFSLEDPAAVVWSTGQVRGPRALPVVFGP